MSATEAYLDELRKIALQYHEGMGAIEPWCNEVARGMGFDSAEDIQAQNGIGFIAHWAGPYGAENHEGFNFEYSDLLTEPDVIVARLKAKQQEESAKLKAEQAAKQEAAERQQYELLHQKFANADISPATRGDGLEVQVD